MAETSLIEPLTGHAEFDGLISRFTNEKDAGKADAIRQSIWERFGTEGTVFISDMASFSSTSRKLGVCHFLKLILRTRQIVGQIVRSNNGLLLKYDADNCYAFFDRPDDAIHASLEINEALFRSNEAFDLEEHIFLSVGIDYGRVLLIDDAEFFGDPVNTASKLGEDLALRADTLVTERAMSRATVEIPELAERMVARISDIEIKYIRFPMTEASGKP